MDSVPKKELVLYIDCPQESIHQINNRIDLQNSESVEICTEVEQILAICHSRRVNLLITDKRSYLAKRKFLDILCRNNELNILITGNLASVNKLIDFYSSGQLKEIIEPCPDFSQFCFQVKKEKTKYKLKNIKREKLKNPDVFKSIISNNPKILNIFMLIEKIAVSSYPVLITGESGTGKDLIAKSIYDSSSQTGRFISINVAGLDDTVFADTLFGHKTGAFTGASKDREGLLAQAKDGTIFLDEIGDLSHHSQIKLLRLLQNKEYYPLGADRPSKTNVRFIMATNANLPEKVNNGKFRKDLFYRLHVHHFYLPTLRQRPEDIPLLVDFFIKKTSFAMNKSVSALHPKIYELLAAYSFPGNIRELESLISSAVCMDRLHDFSFFENYILEHSYVSKETENMNLLDKISITKQEYLPNMEEMEYALIRRSLQLSHGNQTEAAKMLGMAQPTFWRKIKKMNDLIGTDGSAFKR